MSGSTTLPDNQATKCQRSHRNPYTMSVIPRVRDVLALPVLTEGHPRIVGGGQGLDAPVRWIHLSDAADLTGLLQGGELMMTTGGALAQDDERVAAYLRMLADLGVVGLVVELGTSLRRLPDLVPGLADELGLPVVVLERRTRFVDVTEQVHRWIVSDRYDELQFARATHETFTSLNIRRAAPADIVTTASQILDAPVVLEDLNRHVLAFDPAGSPAASLLDRWSERSRRNRDPMGEPVEPADATAGADSSTWFTVPVGVPPERWGRLVLPCGASDVPRATMVLERTAQSLQLQRMLEQDRDAVLVHALGGLLDDLVTGRVDDEAEAQARAVALGMSAGARYVPLVVAVPRGGGGDALAQSGVDRRVLSAVRAALTTAGLTGIASIRRQGTIAVLMSTPSPAGADQARRAVCDRLSERLAGSAGTDSWVAGTATDAPELLAAAAGLAEAEHVAEVGLATRTSGERLFRSSDVRLRGLLALLRTDHRVQAFVESELGRLLAHDARTGEDLMSVLRAFLASGGSKSDTARATGLARPTLYARLARIERILGAPLESAESRTSLHAALMVIDMPGDAA